EDAITLIARHADGGMRDALSLLDQCLSFGEGAITAERVREILGLVADELYADLLSLVVGRRPAAVFPLIERLLDAGADLAEFMGGAADLLRALLMLQVGADPEGLTEATRRMLTDVGDQLAPGDILRMLRLLGEAEGAIRRSSNARLVVETLLLRWAMLDRIVDLQAVLDAEGSALAAPSSEPPASRTPRSGSRSSERRSSDPPPPAAAPRAGSGTIDFTLPAIEAAWGELVAAVREQGRFLGEALAMSRPTAAEPPVLAVTPTEGAIPDALEQRASQIEAVLAARLGQPVRLQVRHSEPTQSSGDPAPARPRRMTPEGLRADRLECLRARDPALDAAADELDLEIVD
ncbi:MAG TPA: hypothetical protein VFL95_08955, partial [Gemmatimonadales bacterium]|nr:hypothetical protein [Gemmatimonadales bacterium]